MADRSALLQKMNETSFLLDDLRLYLDTQSCTKYPGQKHFTWTDGPVPWDNQGGA